VTAAQAQFTLAKASGKPDVNLATLYSHQSGASSLSLFFSVPLPVFNRNQGEVARTESATVEASLAVRAAEDTVRTDVRNAYEAVRTAEDLLSLYEGGYLVEAAQARDITEYAYRQGAASLLDFLDAERNYRSMQMNYRQALANHALAVVALRHAVCDAL
jgi:outer membrane protein, heavy metal efflux system